MNVLLTGGYGFIGAWIIRSLLKRGANVSVLDLKEDPRRLKLILPDSEVAKVKFIAGDVTDLPAITKSIHSTQATHIIHLAGLQVPTCKADPMLGAKVNVLGTLAVFEAVRQSAGQVQRIVYASSAAVFGPPNLYPSSSIGDEGPLVPGTHYGVFKCCNEGNARIYLQDHGIASVGLRPWTVYGVGRDLGMTSEPTKAIKAVVLSRPYNISFGGLTDFQYVDDVAETFVLSLERPYRGANSYNMRGEVARLEQFHEALVQVIPAAKELVTVGTAQIAIQYDLDDSALEKDLGPMPKTKLVDGIRDTVKRFQALHAEGRLDTSDLDGPKPAPVTISTET